MIVIEKDVILAILLFGVLDHLWDTYICLRQYKIYKTQTKLPDTLKEVMSEEMFEKSRLYNLDKITANLVQAQFSELIGVLMIVTPFQVTFWNWSADAVKALGLTLDSNEIFQSCAFMLITDVLNTVVSMPFVVYRTFWVEQIHGFNKQTPAFFVKDQLKMIIVSQFIKLPFIAITVYIVHNGGDYFFMYLWACLTVLGFAFMTIYPEFIAPLFDKYTALPDGELKTRIEKLASDQKFPLYKLYVVEGSKRSAHSNAYLYGMFNNKRIVLFDTLIKGFKRSDAPEDDPGTTKGCDIDEIEAVIGHELGHWKLCHTIKGIIIFQINLFFVCLVFSQLFKYETLYRAFGFSDKPVVIGLIIILTYILAPYNTVSSFLTTTLSRKFEFEADAFAKSLGLATPLKSSLIKLTTDNLSFPVYDWLYSAWNHSHPPLLQRLEAIGKTD